jgi:hypothetical protein
MHGERVMSSQKICILLVSLSLVTSTSLAQPSITKIPSFFSGFGSAVLIGARNSIYTIAIAETSGYSPIPENWYSRGIVYVVRRDSTGNLSRSIGIDTIFSTFFGFGGNSDDCVPDAANTPDGNLVVVLNHRQIGYTDVAPNYIPSGAKLRCKNISPNGVVSEIFSQSNANNGSVLVDANGGIHIVYESLVSLESRAPGTFRRARSTVIHRILDSTRDSSASIEADTIGVGFCPQMALDNHSTVYIAWISCDSSWSTSATITLARIGSGVVRKIPIHTVSIAISPYSSVWTLPEIHIAVDDYQNAWVSWSEQQQDTIVFAAYINSNNQVRIDSVHLNSFWSYGNAVCVDKNGIAYLVWTASSSTQTNLLCTSGDSGRRMFESVKTLAPCAGNSYPHLVMDVHGIVHCVYNSDNGIGYVRNLMEVHAPVILVSGTSLATLSYYDFYRNRRAIKKSAVWDERENLLLSFNKPYDGDSSKAGLSLLFADQSVLSVRDTRTSIPRNALLFQNYPNPFNPSTTIRFSIPERSRIHVTIFNLLGQQVAELANEEMNAGNFERIWNANVASGLYFYRLEAVSVSNPSKRFVDVKKMVLVR